MEQDRIETMLKGIEFLEELSKTKSFSNHNIKLQKLPIRGCDDSWECVVKHMTSSPFHYVGTCKMGPESDPEAVVDSKSLKVYGMERLRVIDASVMPDVPRGNTNIPTIMIAEYGSDVVKNDWKQKTQTQCD